MDFASPAQGFSMQEHKRVHFAAEVEIVDSIEVVSVREQEQQVDNPEDY